MKSLRLILGLYVLGWFNLVVPGHTRGIVTLPGTAQGAACCVAHDQPAGKPSSTPTQQTNCAICFVAATYTVPTVYVFFVEPLDLIQTLNDHTVAQLLSLDFPTPYWPIGPPATA